MSDCIFCRIGAGEAPGEKLYQDEELFAIRDIRPQAPTHILIMPRAHIASLRDITSGTADLPAKVVQVANLLAEREGLAARGYRLAVNVGAEGGQAVPHLHFHLIGGRQMSGRLG